MKKVWVIITNFVEGGEEKINDVAIFSNKAKAKQEYGNFVFLAKIKSKALRWEIFLDEPTAFESYDTLDDNYNHIFIKLIEKNVID
jgi:hypothetical protein